MALQGTIFENIAYGNKDATIEKVIEAAKSAKIHSFIKVCLMAIILFFGRMD